MENKNKMLGGGASSKGDGDPNEYVALKKKKACQLRKRDLA